MLHKTLEESGKVSNPSETKWLALGDSAVKLLLPAMFPCIHCLQHEEKLISDTNATLRSLDNISEGWQVYNKSQAENFSDMFLDILLPDYLEKWQRNKKRKAPWMLLRT